MTNASAQRFEGRLHRGFMRAAAAALAALLVAAACSLSPEAAYADVRRGDTVFGETVEGRGLAATQCPDISAERAILVDAAGTVYFERNADDKAHIASMTKIMTAVVALDHASLDESVVVTEEAATVGESSASLREGDVLTMRDALYALLVPSGNDAALTIAHAVGEKLVEGGAAGDPVEAFVAAMNDKAAELGCASTLFANPHGLDDGAWAADMSSTARDMAVIAAHAMENESFREVVSGAVTTIAVERPGEGRVTVELEPTDVLIGTYEGACGIKTGFTAAAGYCFAGAVERDGRYLYAIVMGAPSSEQRFSDTTELFDWVYEHEVEYRFINAPQTATMTRDEGQVEVPVVAEVAHEGWIDARVAVTVSDPEAMAVINDLNGNVSQTFSFDKLERDVRAGDKVGTVTFKQRNSDVLTLDVIACEDMKAPNLFEGIGVWWDRFFRSFSGGQQVAETQILNEVPLVNDKTSFR